MVCAADSRGRTTWKNSVHSFVPDMQRARVDGVHDRRGTLLARISNSGRETVFSLDGSSVSGRCLCCGLTDQYDDPIGLSDALCSRRNRIIDQRVYGFCNLPWGRDRIVSVFCTGKRSGIFRNVHRMECGQCTMLSLLFH